MRRRVRRSNVNLVSARITKRELRRIDRERRFTEFIGGIIEFVEEIREKISINELMNWVFVVVMAVCDVAMFLAFSTMPNVATIDKVLFGGLVAAWTYSGVKLVKTVVLDWIDGDEE